MLEPEGYLVGTLNEDFAVESLAGDIFQLGNASYRILRVERSTVRVEDAHGQPPTIPFWLGEAPGRSDELSVSVSRLREEIEQRFDDCAKKTQVFMQAGYVDPQNLLFARPHVRRVRDVSPQVHHDINALDTAYAEIHRAHPFLPAPDFVAVLRGLLEQPRFRSIFVRN